MLRRSLTDFKVNVRHNDGRIFLRVCLLITVNSKVKLNKYIYVKLLFVMLGEAKFEYFNFKNCVFY